MTKYEIEKRAILREAASQLVELSVEDGDIVPISWLKFNTLKGFSDEMSLSKSYRKFANEYEDLELLLNTLKKKGINKVFLHVGYALIFKFENTTNYLVLDNDTYYSMSKVALERQYIHDVIKEDLPRKKLADSRSRQGLKIALEKFFK